MEQLSVHGPAIMSWPPRDTTPRSLQDLGPLSSPCRLRHQLSADADRDWPKVLRGRVGLWAHTARSLTGAMEEDASESLTDDGPEPIARIAAAVVAPGIAVVTGAPEQQGGGGGGAARALDDEDDDEGKVVSVKRARRSQQPSGPPPDNWTDLEKAQFKKALIVLGNKRWKDMTEFIPTKNATQLRTMYKHMGGSWGFELKPIIREHRYLVKLNKLGERDVWLTAGEIQTVRNGGQILYKLERPDKPGKPANALCLRCAPSDGSCPSL
jgi:hypothetical protein